MGARKQRRIAMRLYNSNKQLQLSATRALSEFNAVIVFDSKDNYEK